MEPDQPRPPAGHVTEHLANERTFLAWVRTALGLIGLGFVLARMGLFLRQLATIGGVMPHNSAKGSHEFLVTGVLFLLLGATVCLGSGWLYHRARQSIEAGRYEPPRHAITALMAVVVAGSLAITGLLIWQVVTLGDG